MLGIGQCVMAARTSNSSVLVEGEPGIGKSSLVREALADAADVGCQVFWSAGDELAKLPHSLQSTCLASLDPEQIRLR